LDKTFWENKKVLVTGGAGFIGAHVANLLMGMGMDPEHIIIPRSDNCDLRVFDNCKRAVEDCQIVIHLAAVTGGINFSRQYPAGQYYDSTMIDLNIAEASRQVGVEKLVALGNLFAYAPDASIPLKEEELFMGLPTDAHRGVGCMKRNLAILADLYFRQYRFGMAVVYSANAYGPGDSTDLQHSHVIPATIMKCLKDPELTVWGDGSPTRDFLYVEDLALGLLLAAEKLPPGQFINIGSGTEVSIRDLVSLIAQFTDFQGKIEYDISKVGGDTRRCTSIELARGLIGFEPKVTFEEGLKRTVEWYQSVL
jgi:GDP-L-fucose synthase